MTYFINGKHSKNYQFNKKDPQNKNHKTLALEMKYEPSLALTDIDVTLVLHYHRRLFKINFYIRSCDKQFFYSKYFSRTVPEKTSLRFLLNS